jgi:uncharacterized tellurite resistance protein B-like protein
MTNEQFVFVKLGIIMFKIQYFTGVYFAILLFGSDAAIAQETIQNNVLITADNSAVDGILIVMILAVLVSPVYIYFNRIRSDTARKRRILQKFTVKDQNIILTMASAAKTDKEIAPSEILKIRQTIENLTQRKVSTKDIERVIEFASDKFNARDLQGVVTGLSVEEKRELLTALFDVISADGKLRKAEREYSRRFCKGLSINQAFFDSVWVDYFEQNPNKLTVE